MKSGTWLEYLTLLYAFKMTFVQLICFNIASHT